MGKIQQFVVTKMLFFLIFWVVLSSSSKARDFDWGTALGIELKKKVSNKLNFGLSQEFRFNDQATNLYRSASQVGLECNFLRKICKVGLFGTFIRKENDQKQFESQYRLGADLSAKADKGSFSFSWRTRMLSTFRDESVGSYKVNPKLSLRNRIQIDYSLFSLPLKPYISCEPFVYLNAQGGAYLNNVRYRLGTDYRLNKRSSWDAGLRLDHEMQVINTSRYLSLDIAYTYKF